MARYINSPGIFLHVLVFLFREPRRQYNDFGVAKTISQMVRILEAQNLNARKYVNPFLDNSRRIFWIADTRFRDTPLGYIIKRCVNNKIILHSRHRQILQDFITVFIFPAFPIQIYVFYEESRFQILYWYIYLLTHFDIKNRKFIRLLERTKRSTIIRRARWAHVFCTLSRIWHYETMAVTQHIRRLSAEDVENEFIIAR